MEDGRVCQGVHRTVRLVRHGLHVLAGAAAGRVVRLLALLSFTLASGVSPAYHSTTRWSGGRRAWCFTR